MSKSLQQNRESESFFEMVYDVVRLIPRGRVSSYGVIGAYLGAARSARMVGWAMNQAHVVSPYVPAHRVVNKQGLLTGKAHFHPPEKMVHLLQEEGVEVADDKIINFSEVFWDPLFELKIE
jgi:methylated-DNA-protein-cysteine methyltransferase related protein